MSSFKSTSKLRGAQTDTVVVQCSDHRVQLVAFEFLNKGLELNGNYELLALPGGPQCMTLVEYMPKFSWALNKWVRHLVDSLELTRMVLIAHQDCGWYKQLPFHLLGSSDPRQRQEDDLRRVRAAMARDFPQLRVALYFVGWDNSNQVTIDSVLG
jgi:hypothetical protein